MARFQNLAAGVAAPLRRALPFGLLVLALGVTGAGAFRAQRAYQSQRETAQGLLRDYGAFAAWSFAQRATGYVDNGLRRTLQPLLAEPRLDSRECLEAALAAAQRRTDECGCGTPLAGRFAFRSRLGADPSGAMFAGNPPAESVRAAVLMAVGRDARSVRGPETPRLVQVPATAGSSLLVAYVLVRATAGDTAVAGVEVDPERLRGDMAQAFGHPDLLPASLTRGAPNDSLLAIRVLGPGGAVLYASSDRATPAIHADQALPDRLAGAVVRAAVLPEAAPALLIGGLPTNRAGGLLALFIFAALLMVLSFSLLRKENDLARLRSDFVASVSHELRTPVAQVRLYVETLRLGRVSTDAEREWAFGRIERETLRLSGLVDRILHFNRVERGTVPAERSPVEVGREVADATASFEALVRPGQARVALDLAQGLMVSAHADSLRQVVLNLLDNAVKYGRHGQTIRVRAERRGARARVVVEDEGPGVPPRERDIIWEPFRRGSSAVGSVTAGGGIGLAVVRDIVAAHRGEAWVEDAPSGGARFVVELPAAAPERRNPHPGAAVPPSPSRGSTADRA